MRLIAMRFNEFNAVDLSKNDQIKTWETTKGELIIL